MADADSAQPRFAIRLEKADFTFSAAHFITYAGDTCEPIHGHNYRVAVEAEGPLDENRYVLDFILARDLLAEITSGLDHRVLLPTEHAEIAVRAEAGPLGGEEVVATFRDRRWVFPASECVLLPVVNTTAELLAEWVARRFLAALGERGIAAPEALTVAVDECDGQSGLCRLGG